MMPKRSDAVIRMLSGYEQLIRRFASGESSADQFEIDFLSYFKTDTNQVISDEFDILDGLFADVDEYVGDARLRPKTGGIDEDELRHRAREAYLRLYGEL